MSQVFASSSPVKDSRWGKPRETTDVLRKFDAQGKSMHENNRETMLAGHLAFTDSVY